MTTPELITLTDDALADEICTWAGRAAAAEARLLTLIGEYDARGAWAQPGLLSCAHWLSWRIGMGLKAARERVRVARTLRDLPLMAAEFGAGRLSWTQVRALTRIATPSKEKDLVELAGQCTGAQIEKIARGVRRSEIANDPDQEQVAWRMRPRVTYDDDGTLVMTLRYPAQQAAVVLAALEALQAQIDAAAPPVHVPEPAPQASAEACVSPLFPELKALSDELNPDFVLPPEARTKGPTFDPPPRATVADALLVLCQRAVDGALGRHPRARRRLTVQLDPHSGWRRTHDGELLPPELTRLDAGRSQRFPSEALRALIGNLDGERCRIPGCSRTRRLHAHHVKWWGKGGRTDLANLCLVCEHHHTMVHEGLLSLSLLANRRLEVTDAAGRPVRHVFDPPWDEGEIDAEPIAAHWKGDRLDLDHVVWVVRQQAA